MKFKQGDTVYLKATIDNIKNRSRGICIDLGHDVGYNYCEEHNLFTKQEMLEELQKPEFPKVGEVWQHSSGDCVQVVFLSNNNIFFEYKDSFSTPGSMPIKLFLERFKKVES